MTLPGCAARTIVDPGPAPVIAVKVADTPPPELTVCAVRPEGLPEDPATWATIPPAVRAALMRFAEAFGSNADRLDRLAEWHLPGACNR